MKYSAAAMAMMGMVIATTGSAQTADPAKVRQTATQVCAACHGADGNSAAPANPHLAGQHAAYIAKQLADFKANKDRKNPVMMGMAANLSPAEMKGLGEYFSQQKAKPATAKDKDLAALGQKIYRGGVAATGVAACAACHGPNGAGIPAQYPRVAGQFADYTLAQLKAFAGEQRTNDPGKVMQSIAVRMTDKEMRAVAEYMSGLR